MKDRAARGGVHKADQIPPLVAMLVAMLDWSQGALARHGPDFVQEGFETNPVFVGGPHLNPSSGESRCHIPAQFAEPPLKASWAAASAAWICRGRGAVRRQPRRRKVRQPR